MMKLVGRRVGSLVLLLVGACSGAGLPEDTVVPESCVEPAGGAWSASGGCFGMDMSTEATVVQSCGVEFGSWSMPMSTPTSAVVDGRDVTFFGDGWESCSGVLSEDGKEIEGACDDGCDLSMRSAG